MEFPTINPLAAMQRSKPFTHEGFTYIFAGKDDGVVAIKGQDSFCFTGEAGEEITASTKWVHV